MFLILACIGIIAGIIFSAYSEGDGWNWDFGDCFLGALLGGIGGAICGVGFILGGIGGIFGGLFFYIIMFGIVTSE